MQKNSHCLYNWRKPLAWATVACLVGCASGPNADPRDPLEPLNREVHHFNQEVDRVLAKPIAKAYVNVLPSPVRTGVNNFFGNWRDVWSAVNAVLQCKPREAAENTLRFGMNTTLGLLGVMDIASEVGIQRTTLDFGTTLGRWGVPDGPYVVLPLLGPSTLRDTAALSMDNNHGDLLQHVDHQSTHNELLALRLVDQRAGLLRVGDVLDAAALDSYTFLRDSYLQRRDSLIGRPQVEERYDLE